MKAKYSATGPVMPPAPLPTHRGFRNLTGLDNGIIVVKSYAGPVPGHHLWNIFCKECKRWSVQRSNNILNRPDGGCGCQRKNSHARHRMAGTKEWAAWQGMKQRCFNPDNSEYPNYGGRGITVCPDWANSFDAWYAYVGPAPSKLHSIGRINNDGNYEPENVRWELRVQQARNTRTNRFIELDGLRLTVAEWAERSGMKMKTLHARLTKGMSLACALSTPLRK